MNKTLILLGIVAGLLVLSQWYVFLCVRNFIWGRQRPITRPVAYPVLAILAFANYLGVKISMSAVAMQPDLSGHKLVAVAYFSYLGFVLLTCLFLGLLELGALLLYVRDVVAERWGIRASRPSAVVLVTDGPGSQSSPTELTGGDLPPAHLPRGCRAESNQPAANEAMAANDSHAPTVDGTSRVYSRRAFLKWGTVASLTTAGVLSSGGVARAYGRPVIERFDFVHPALVNMGRSLTVIQITDFHFGLFFGRQELEKLANEVNAVEADALFITGDVFHAPMSPVEEAAPLLRRFRPRKHGNFAVLGNHDFYAGESRSVETLQKAGMTVLRDEWVTLKEGGTEIYLGGIDDPVADWVWGRAFPNFASFMKDAPRRAGLRLLLSHRPSILDFAANAGIDLIFAGHIHGGQIILPVPGNDRGVSLAAIVSPYTHGWYRRGDSRMYLNRGAGLTFVPWRINCPPEITVFRLLPPGSRQNASLEPSVSRS